MVETGQETGTGQEQISFDLAFEAARRYKPELNEKSLKKLAKRLQNDPALYGQIRAIIPKKSAQDIEHQLDNLATVLGDAHRGYEQQWTPKNPTEYYTPAQQRVLRWKTFADSHLGWVLGGQNTVNYQKRLLPEVRVRYKTKTISALEEGVKELNGMSLKMEQLRDDTETELLTLVELVQQEDVNLQVSEEMLRELPDEITNTRKGLAAKRQADATVYAKSIEELKSLRKEKREYEKSQRQATNNILVYKREIMRSRTVLDQVAPLSDRILDFHSDMDLLHRSLKVYEKGAFEVVNPGVFIRLNGVYEQAKGILQRLDEAFTTMGNALRRATPTSFTTGMEEPELTLGQTEESKAYTIEQTNRRKEARNFAKQLRETDMPYL